MRKVGRPTQYKEEYCDMLIEHMAQGYSFEAFGAVIRCGKQTLYNWTEAHPEFLDAKKTATELCRKFWEKVGIDFLVNRNSESINAAMWIYNMKCRFPQEWRETVQINSSVEHSVKDLEKMKSLPEADLTKSYFDQVNQKTTH